MKKTDKYIVRPEQVDSCLRSLAYRIEKIKNNIETEKLKPSELNKIYDKISIMSQKLCDIQDIANLF